MRSASRRTQDHGLCQSSRRRSQTNFNAQLGLRARHHGGLRTSGRCGSRFIIWLGSTIHALPCPTWSDTGFVRSCLELPRRLGNSGSRNGSRKNLTGTAKSRGIAGCLFKRCLRNRDGDALQWSVARSHSWTNHWTSGDSNHHHRFDGRNRDVISLPTDRIPSQTDRMASQTGRLDGNTQTTDGIFDPRGSCFLLCTIQRCT